MSGGKGIRTPDPLHAMQVLYQLSYTPGLVFNASSHSLLLNNPSSIGSSRIAMIGVSATENRLLVSVCSARDVLICHSPYVA